MSAEDVSSWLGELLKLSKVEKRSEAERGRLEELCRLLRGVGYTNQWIEEFTEGRLPSGSIKRWTRGVEVKDTSGKDELMSELRAFVDRGYKVSDLGEYADAKKSLDDLPMTFAQCSVF